MELNRCNVTVHLDLTWNGRKQGKKINQFLKIFFKTKIVGAFFLGKTKIKLEIFCGEKKIKSRYFLPSKFPLSPNVRFTRVRYEWTLNVNYCKMTTCMAALNANWT